MYGHVVLAYGADQKSVNAYGKRKLVTGKNAFLHSLTVQNKGAADFWVQVYDVTGADEDAAGAAADLVDAEFEVVCPLGSYVPFAFASPWRFHNGIYVRCVATVAGAEADLIGSSDAKITAAYMNGPLATI